MKLKLIKSCVIAAGLTCGMGLAHASTVKIGSVDFLKVFKQVPQGQAALANIKTSLQPKLDDLKKQKVSLEKSLDGFKRNAPTMTKVNKLKQQKALLEKQEAFQKEYMAIQQGSAKSEQDAALKFQKAMKSAVAELAKKDGYTLIVNTDAAAYVDPKSDVTDQVIKLMK